MHSLDALNKRIARCRLCPRLVDHRESIARRKTRRFQDSSYWGRPVPGFGDPRARLLIVGLAPAAHGANRTGRMFTGDRSGEWLYEALYRFGFANQPTSTGRGDGMVLHNCYITAAVRCAPPANKPTAAERDTCRTYLAEEMRRLPEVRCVVALGQIAFVDYLKAWRGVGGFLPVPRPRFGHNESYPLGGGTSLVASYHPSQQNTFTGRLTRRMFHSVFRKASELC